MSFAIALSSICNELIYVEAGQLVCDANEQPGFYVVWVSTKNILYTSWLYHHFQLQILMCQEIELSYGLFRDFFC